MGYFKKAVDRKGDKLALVSVDGMTWTWNQYYEDTLLIASSLITMGLNKHDSVSIIGFNSPYWFISNMSAIAAGGKAAGIYTTNTADPVKFIVKHSETKFAFCEDKFQLDKFLVNINNLPLLKGIIVWKKGEIIEDYVINGCKVFSWESFVKLGVKSTDAVNRRIENTVPGECCALVYTSGTTGNPKACMISNDNILFQCASVCCMHPQLGENVEHVLSYLPLSHCAGQMIDLYSSIFITATKPCHSVVHFADSGALKGTLGEFLKTVRPTIFLGVPRVWEKIGDVIKSKFSKSNFFLRHFLSYIMSIGAQMSINQQIDGDKSIPWNYNLLDWLILSNIRKALGLDRCHLGSINIIPLILFLSHTCTHTLSLSQAHTHTHTIPFHLSSIF